MYRTLLVLVIIICFGNAAIVVNVPDNDISSNHVEDVTSCDDGSCNTLCQNLGFTNGICVNNQCTCIRKELAKNLLSAFGGLDSCSPLECDQRCRRIGFPGGACVNDRCKCDILAKDEPLLSAVGELDNCSPLECDQRCRRIGFPGGACVNDRCKCDILAKDESSRLAAWGVDSCSPLECDQRCRRIGFPGGACVKDHCKCDILAKDENKIPAQDAVITKQVILNDEEKPVVDTRTSILRGSCDCIPYNCDKYCFRIHYIGGICVDGHCRCYK